MNRKLSVTCALFAALALTACELPNSTSSSGGGIDSDGSGEGPLEPPEFQPFGVLDATTVSVDPAVGATIEVGDASLDIPAGALAAPADVSLVQVDVPAAELPPADGALGGYVTLSDAAYVILAGEEVELNEPIHLRLPVDPARFPEGGTIDDVEIGYSAGGYLVPQGSPDSVGESFVGVVYDVPNLPAGGGVLLVPEGVAISFLAIAAGVGLGLQVAQPVLAIMDDVRSAWAFTAHLTDHFRIRWRDPATEADAQRVGELLERARLLYVDDMGFSTPNWLNFDGRYTVYLDAMSNHSLVPPDATDGFTFPGGFYLEGASYINATANTTDRAEDTTAAHEYFHALQQGAVTRFTPNSFGRLFDLEADWLFEGVATVMSGRIYANTGGPARAGLQNRLALGESMWNPQVQFPAADVAQDFFFHLERELGGTDFYLPMFQRVGSPDGGDREPSVEAVDSVLRDLGTGLPEQYGGFVREMLLDDPSAFGYNFPRGDEVLPTDGETALRASRTVQPLGYSWVSYRVPPFDPDVPEDEQPAIATVTALVTSGSADDVRVFAQTRDGTSEEVPTLATGEELQILLNGARSNREGAVRFAIANTSLDAGEAATVEVSAMLGEQHTGGWYGAHVETGGELHTTARCSWFDADGNWLFYWTTGDDGECWEYLEPGLYRLEVSSPRYKTIVSEHEVVLGDSWLHTVVWSPCDIGATTACDDECWNYNEDEQDCGGVCENECPPWPESATD